MIAGLAVQRVVPKPERLQVGYRKAIVGDLRLLQAQHVRADLAYQPLEAGKTRAHRVDVPGGDP